MNIYQPEMGFKCNFSKLFEMRSTYKLKWRICIESEKCEKWFYFAISRFTLDENYAESFLPQPLKRKLAWRTTKECWSIYLLNFHNNCIRDRQDDLNFSSESVEIHWKSIIWHCNLPSMLSLFAFWPCVSALSCCLFILTAAPDLVGTAPKSGLE